MQCLHHCLPHWLVRCDWASSRPISKNCLSFPGWILFDYNPGEQLVDSLTSSKSSIIHSCGPLQILWPKVVQSKHKNFLKVNFKYEPQNQLCSTSGFDLIKQRLVPVFRSYRGPKINKCLDKTVEIQTPRGTTSTHQESPGEQNPSSKPNEQNLPGNV